MLQKFKGVVISKKKIATIQEWIDVRIPNWTGPHPVAFS
jgi:hypothetical protein